LVPKVIVTLVPVLVVDVVVVDGEVEVALVGAVVVALVVVVGALDDGVVVVFVAGACEVLGSGVNGLVVEPEPPNVSKTISASSSTTRTPNKTNAQGERYHGRGGFSGGPGGCCPYPPYWVGCSEDPPGGCCPYPPYWVGCSEG
jgi:hypothetical protein